VSTEDIRRSLDALWRIESPKLIARLARIVRDVGIAEELAQDVFVAALEQWPGSGIPENPAAWLMGVGKHRAVDRVRGEKRTEQKHEQIARERSGKRDSMMEDLDAALDDDVGDDLLRLIFTACHPALSTEAQVALTLRLLGGLTTEEIARAFLIPEPTAAQRIVRAKRTLAEKQVGFEAPRGDQLSERLGSVLGVIYLIFNEGYAATVGDEWMRPSLCEDALRLGRILAELAPTEPEVHGLVALMEIQASRTAARTSATGEPILLLDQDRSRWDQLLIRRGLVALSRAQSLGAAPGSYLLQAGIAACHARAHTADQTDWRQIAQLYSELVQLTPNPVVALNRAVAVAMAFGPQAGLELLDAIKDKEALQNYHLLPSVRGDLLMKLGRNQEAQQEFERAATLTRNARERDLLQERARFCRDG
jgi:RNA polymerase sigma factor (sigma-70 family)